MDSMTISRDAVDRTRLRYERETEGHTLQILHDSGAYRHLRFTGPNGFYWYDLHTAPGTLTVTGGMGTYVFRIDDTDTLAFFTHGRAINPGYWAEKLRASDGTSGHYGWDQDLFTGQVNEVLAGWTKNMDSEAAAALSGRVEDEVLYYAPWETSAMDAVRLFDVDGHRFGDTDEWTLHGYTEQYLFCCWAIFHGASSYRTHARKAS